MTTQLISFFFRKTIKYSISGSVSEQHGGKVVDFDDAKFIFSEDSECDDTKRFVNLYFFIFLLVSSSRFVRFNLYFSLSLFNYLFPFLWLSFTLFLSLSIHLWFYLSPFLPLSHSSSHCLFV